MRALHETAIPAGTAEHGTAVEQRAALGARATGRAGVAGCATFGRAGSKRRASRLVAILAAALLLVFSGHGAFAQTDSIETDEDALFGSAIETDDDALFGASDDVFSEPLVSEIEETETDIASILLSSDEVRIGGRYSMSISGGAGWADLSTVADNLFEPDATPLTTDLSAQIYLDARPDEELRILAKATTSYPFETGDDRSFEDVVRVDEVFADFQWGDSVFFRAGKQTLNWGVGYFYSPADLLSLAEIDPDDPEAELEGPLAVKANIPVDIHNVYLYVLPEYADEPLDTGVAAKGEVVVGDMEITGGIIYQRDIAPAGMMTLSTTLGDFNVFAEGMVSYGSNRRFVRETEGFPGVEVYTVDDEIFFSATAGTSYSYSPDEREGSLMITAQYLYNGEGYEDPAILTDNQMAIGGFLTAGDLVPGDLMNAGRHYSAAQVSWRNILESDVTGSIFWLQNYSDMSARVTPSLSTTLFDAVSLSLQMPLAFGESGDEFSPTGDSLSLSLTASLSEAF